MPSIGLGVLLCVAPLASASAQEVDCGRLSAEIAALRRPIELDTSQALIRQQRLMLQRSRDEAQDLGCAGPADPDDPEQPQCQIIARRMQRIEDGLQKLQAQSVDASPEAAERRRTLTEQYDAYCSNGDAPPRASGLPFPDTLPGPEDDPTLMPIAPETPGDAPQAPATKLSRVICVRQCDGAYYPLAIDVPSDQLEGMDRLCKAQCPNAQASAYSAREDEEIGKAVASDGTPYSALPTAFAFQKAVVPACSCRAPHATWAETLAAAETTLEPQKGDVTVTPEIAAAMARPVPQKTAAPVAPSAAGVGATEKPRSGKKASKKALRPTTEADDPDTGSLSSGADLTRQFRRAAPTL